MKRFHVRGVVRLAAVAGIAVGGCLVAAAPSYAATPTAKASPNTGLINGSVVSVSGSGFTAGATVAIVQCNNKVITDQQAACNTSNVVTATVSATGTVPKTNFTVATGTIGTDGGACNTTPGKPPTASNTCYIAIANVANTSEAAIAKITFLYGPYAKAKPNTGLTNGATVTVTGGGFTPGATVAIVECNHKVKTDMANACDTSAVVTATVSKSGAVPATVFTAITGSIGSDGGSCVTSSAPTANNVCYLAVANVANQTQAAIAKITFQN